LSGVPNWITISKYDGDESGGSGEAQIFTAHFVLGEADGDAGPQALFVGSNILNPVAVRASKKKPFQCLAVGYEAPSGADIIFDIKRNGTSIFNNPVHVTDGETLALSADLVDAEWYFGDILTIDVTQIGSTSAGKGFTIYVDYR
jgi:hypothetical protein